MQVPLTDPSIRHETAMIRENTVKEYSKINWSVNTGRLTEWKAVKYGAVVILNIMIKIRR